MIGVGAGLVWKIKNPIRVRAGLVSAKKLPITTRPTPIIYKICISTLINSPYYIMYLDLVLLAFFFSFFLFSVDWSNGAFRLGFVCIWISFPNIVIII